jgi:hypothetical protein
MRVEIPAYTDRWMMGDRCGDVVKVTKARKNRQVAGDTGFAQREVAHVKLDKSGKTVRVIFADCTLI